MQTYGWFKVSALLLLVLLVLAQLLLSPRLMALPEGEVINAGSGSISRSGNNMTIHQTSQRLSANYQSFDIGAGEHVLFIQPGRDSVALNRVIGANASQIFGQLQANGQVFLINPNGIVFGEGASVDVGGLLATTLSLSDDDFFSNNLNFSASSNGSVSNQGLITAAENGYLALVSNHVSNSGQMLAPKGSIELLAADEILISLNDQSIAIESTRETLRGLVENHGLLTSTGGRVVMNSYSLDSLNTTVVNNTGVIEASSLQDVGGEIVISGMGGDVFNDGSLDVSAAENNADAGQVAISGDRIAQRGSITADGLAAGVGGRIELQAESELFATAGSSASANGGTSGDGGEIIYFSDGNALFDNGASISARGGEFAGDGGFAEVSGLQWVSAEGFVDTRAPKGLAGTFLIDPTDITIVAGNVDSNGSFTGDNWTTGGPTSQIGTDNITSQLLTNNVVIDSTTGAGGTGDINVNAAIDLEGGNGRSLTLQAFNDLNITENICEGGGTCNFSDDSVSLIFTSGGTTTISDGVTIDSGNSTIIVNSTVAAAITGLSSRSSSNEAIRVSTGGAIIQNGDINSDFHAENGGLKLIATSGIGITGGDLSGVAESLDILLTSTGDANLRTTSGDVNLTAATIAAFSRLNINVDGGGSLTVSNSIDTGELALTAEGDITINDGVLIDSGTDVINLNAGGDALITGLLTLNSSDTAVTVNAVGSIIDNGDSNTDIDASSGRAVLISGSGINSIDTQIASVDIDNSSGSVSVNDADNLYISSLNNSSNSADISVNGDIVFDGNSTISSQNLTANAAFGNIIIADTGLSVTGDLSLLAQDISSQSSRSITITSDDFTYSATNSVGDIEINSNISRIDVEHSNGSVSINESNSLKLMDLDADTSAASVSDGNLLIALASGDLEVSNNVTVIDNTADGIRAGLIDLKVNNGEINIGSTGTANIVSSNTVDEDALGGLGTDPSDQVAIRLLQTSTANSSKSFSLGDGAGNDVSINAQGGDILIDAIGAANLTQGVTRQVNLYSDVTISSTDSYGGNSGAIILDGVTENGASLAAADNRSITIRGLTAALEPPVEPPVVDTDVFLTDVIADELQVSGVGKNAPDELIPVNRQLTHSFNRVFTGCEKNPDGDVSTNSDSCAVQNTIRQFLNSFIIGGEIPLMGEK